MEDAKLLSPASAELETASTPKYSSPREREWNVGVGKRKESGMGTNVAMLMVM
jgi:hypothetical protein